MKKPADVMVTGATGFIGRFVVRELSARGHRVWAWARGGQRRADELHGWLRRHGGDPDRVHMVGADLERADLGLSADDRRRLEDVEVVVHAAARFAFELDPDAARATNVEGSLRVLDFVATHPRRPHLIALGGYRLAHGVPKHWSGMPSEAQRGELYERLGAYHASKLEEYVSLKHEAPAREVSLSVVHPAAVIGDAASGVTTQLTGLGEVARDLWLGKLPAKVGSQRTWVPLVTVDHLARFVAGLAATPVVRGAPREYWLLDPATPRLFELMKRMAALMNSDVPALRLSKALVARLPRALTGVGPEQLDFLSDDDYPVASALEMNRRLGLTFPDVNRALERWLTYLIGTRFLTVRAPEGPVRFVDTEHARVFCVGSRAPRAVFLHGLPFDSDSFVPVIERCPLPTLRVDLPGLGRSRGPRDAQWLLDLLPETPVTLVGHSLGAGLAVAFARRYPERVGALVLVAPAFLQRRASWALRTPPLFAAMLRFGDPARLPAALGVPSQPALDSAAAHFRRPGGALAVARALAYAAHPRVRSELVEQLAALRVPTTVLVGQKDPLVGIPPAHARVEVVEGAGHNLHLTHPERVADAVLASTEPRLSASSLTAR